MLGRREFNKLFESINIWVRYMNVPYTSPCLWRDCEEVLFFPGLELIFHSLKTDHCVYCVILQVKGHRKEDGLGISAGCFGRCK